MANITSADRIAHAAANRMCLACAHYCGQFTSLSSRCAIGGLDPEWTNAARSQDTADIRSTVVWSNRCPRFEQFAEAEARASESYIPAVAA